jgi:hypothetical protein
VALWLSSESPTVHSTHITVKELCCCTAHNGLLPHVRTRIIFQLFSRFSGVVMTWDGPQSSTALQDRLCQRLRILVQDCLGKHLHGAAAYFGDKLVTLGSAVPEDVFLLAQVLLRSPVFLWKSCQFMCSHS